MWESTSKEVYAPLACVGVFSNVRGNVKTPCENTYKFGCLRCENITFSRVEVIVSVCVCESTAAFAVIHSNLLSLELKTSSCLISLDFD